MIAVDTNLLVYAHRSGLPEHRAAKRALERARRDSRGWGIALPSVSEFWSVVTHPASRGRPSTPREARAFLDVLLTEGGAVLLTPRQGFADRLLELATALSVAGARVFDLQVALTAFESGATEIWTHDSRFLALPGLRVHDPLQVFSGKR
jgi:toxin-antitoxin system PIN domain toxin